MRAPLPMAAADGDGEPDHDASARAKIEELIQTHKIVLFMKGTRCVGLLWVVSAGGCMCVYGGWGITLASFFWRPALLLHTHKTPCTYTLKQALPAMRLLQHGRSVRGFIVGVKGIWWMMDWLEARLDVRSTYTHLKTQCTHIYIQYSGPAAGGVRHRGRSRG